MTPADLERLADYGIRTQIDLRRTDEIEHQGRGPLERLGSRYVWHPVIPDGGAEKLDQLVGAVGISGERYLRYLDFDSAPWRGLFELMADADHHPVLIHCTAGKDRTGIITALVLSVLGVDRGMIEADYVLTNRDRKRQVDFVEQTEGLPDGITRDELLHSTGVPEDAISIFLDGLEREHGGPLEYLRRIGIDDAMQSAIRNALLEPAD